MIVVLHSILFLCCCLSVSAAATDGDVSQMPAFLLAGIGDTVAMNCSDPRSSHLTKYWYRQRNGAISLVGYTYNTEKPVMESQFPETKVTITPDTAKRSTLTIHNVSPEDSATYFCASSIGDANQRLYFGEGTVLFVLENGEERKQPEVKVYRPNKKEFKEHNLISLVCVANGFYPEHVRLHWYMNGIKRDNIYPNVPQLNSDNKTYFTSKRLSLTRSEYFNPQNTFKCVAGFIDDESGKINDEIMGEADCSVSREQYGMSINQGKISYIMVMCKSGLYGIIVLFIIWRRKVIAASK